MTRPRPRPSERGAKASCCMLGCGACAGGSAVYGEPVMQERQRQTETVEQRQGADLNFSFKHVVFVSPCNKTMVLDKPGLC